MATSATSSIEINAPVEKVFAFMADPVASVEALPNYRDIVVSDIETDQAGVVTAYTYRAKVGIVPFSMRTESTVTEHLPNHKLVERDSFGVNTVLVEPTGHGTRLTFTVESTTKVPLIDKVAILMVSNGRGLGHWLDEFLKETKRRLEA